MYCEQYRDTIRVGGEAQEIQVTTVNESNMDEFLESLQLKSTDILPADQGGIDDKQFSTTKSARVILATVAVDQSNSSVKIVSQDDDEGTDFKYDDLLETEVSSLILPNEM